MLFRFATRRRMARERHEKTTLMASDRTESEPESVDDMVVSMGWLVSRSWSWFGRIRMMLRPHLL